MSRPAYSIEEIKQRLLEQLENVVQRYGCPGPGAYRKGVEYFMLNPGRPDRHVGSFKINMSGPFAGNWKDFATGDRGDVLDLIRLSLRCDATGAIKEARAFLGLDIEDAATRERRNKAAAAAAKDRAEAAARDAQDADRRSSRAHALWLGGQSTLRGTPVARYLAGRAIDLSTLGRQPGVLRFVPRLRYYDMDNETGEILSDFHDTEWPGMVAAITNHRGVTIGCHRTYLAMDPATGQVHKAPVPQPKKVSGRFKGGSINVWAGACPRNGKAPPLSKAPPGSHVCIAEGIEDALSAVILDPTLRVIAAVSLGNMGQVPLPSTIAGVTLIADNDAGTEAREMLSCAIEAHHAKGRTVRLWRSPTHKDLNEALIAEQKEGAA